MQRRRALLGLASALPAVAAHGAGPKRLIRMAAGEFQGDRRHEFPLELFRSALIAATSAIGYTPVYGMNQHRIERSLIDGNLDISILPSTGFDRRRLAYLPFPIRRGLLGLRLVLVRNDDVERFARIESMRELRQMRMGVAADWIEARRLPALGFNLVEGSYLSLFDMLRGGRVDYLTRSVGEVFIEMDNRSLVGDGLSIVPRIAMFYPLDDYFVAQRTQLSVLKVLSRGLSQLLRSGEYWSLFTRHYGSALLRTELESRRVFQVTGFGVDSGTPLDLFDILELRPTRGEFRLPPEVQRDEIGLPH